MGKERKKYKSLAVNTGLFALMAMATKFTSFFLVPLYTYYLTKEEFGLTDISVTVISLLTPLLTLSVAEAAVRFMIDDRKGSGRYAIAALSVSFVSVIAVCFLTPLFDLNVFGGLGDYKIWFIFAYSANVFFQLCSELSRGMGKIKIIVVCSTVSSATTLATAFISVGALGLSVVGYFISVTIGPCIAVMVYLTKGGMGTIFRAEMKAIVDGSHEGEKIIGSLKSMLLYSLPLIPNSLFWWVGTSINRFFITGMLGIAATGLFAAGGKIPNLINAAYSVFQQAWQLSAFQESKEKDIERFFSVIFVCLQASMIVLCSALALASPWLAELLLQKDFYEAWTIIPMLLLANLFNIFNSFVGTVYTSAMKTKYLMFSTVVGAILCVILTLALVFFFGIIGACVASCVGNAVVFVMRIVNSRKILEIKVAWPGFIVCNLLLIVQSFAPVICPDIYMPIAWAIFVLITIIQLLQLYRSKMLGIIIKKGKTVLPGLKK